MDDDDDNNHNTFLEYFILIAPCSVPQIINGMVENLPPRTKIQHGQPINVTCIPNYDLAFQSNPIVCYNGSWSQSPNCVPGLLILLKKLNNSSHNNIDYDNKF